MSTLPVDLAMQIGKIIPRLASAHSGEVAATAAALLRKLKSRGYDLNDLAQHLVEGAPPAPSRKPPQGFSYESWRRMPREADPLRRYRRQLALCQRMREKQSPWERQFIESIDWRLAYDRPLTPRQVTTLGIIAKRMEAWS